MSTKYVIYQGDNILKETVDKDKALQFYKNLPDTSGKAWTHRKRLVEEKTLKEDKR